MQTQTKVLEKLKYSTFLRIVLDGIAKLGLRLTPYYVVREGIWGNGLPGLEKGDKEYELRFLSEEDMGPLSRLPGRNFSENQLIRRLKDGHLCLGLLKDGRVVAFNWANPHESSGNLCRFPLKADEAYLYDAYTIHAYRGKRLAPYLRYQTYRRLAELGMTTLYSISDALNTPAVKFKKKLNARFVQLGVMLALLNRYETNFTVWRSRDFMNRIISRNPQLS